MRPIAYWRLDGLAGSDSGSPITRIGKHVSVTVPDRRQMQEALDELRRIEADLARELPGR